MKDPLLLPALAVVSGILLAHAARFELGEMLAATALFLTLTLVAWRWAQRLTLSCCLVTLACAGVLIDMFHRPGKAPQIDAGSRETVILDGCVVEPTIFYEGRDQFTLELAPNASARVTLAIREGEQPPDLRYGQRVELEGRVRPIRNYNNPGSFDYVAYSAARHIYWNVSAATGEPVRILPGRCGSRLLSLVFALRGAALRRIENLYPNNPYVAGILEATLIGETAKLEKVWTDHFRRTGTFHALVIAGLHITMLAAVLLFLMRLCFVPELPALATAALMAWIYALISGWNPPAVRAAGGFTLYVMARYFYRRGRILNLLAFLALVYLSLDPSQLFEAGFQLSFLSVAAIAALAMPLIDATSKPYAWGLRDLDDDNLDPRLQPRVAQFRVELRLLAVTLSYYLRAPRRWLLAAMCGVLRFVCYAYDMAVISTVIQVGLALPMAIYFHRVSLSGLSANIIVAPLLLLMVPVGFGAVFTGWKPFVVVTEGLLIVSERVAAWHVRFEPDWRVPDPPVWLSIAFVVALLSFSFTLRGSRWIRWLRWPGLCAVLGLFALVYFHPFAPRAFKGQLELSAIDVGQGDSLLLAFPDGKLMAIDGGGILTFGRKSPPKLDIGEDVVSPYLWSRSIRKLDVIALTHGHQDHAGGLGALIENFHPRELWIGSEPKSQVWAGIQQKALRLGVKIVELRTGRAFDFGGARIEVISPPADYQPGESPGNDDSLGMRVTYGRRSFLLTGDMEKPMEARAIDDGLPLRADVLKVGHHGSKTSSMEPFLDAVAPTFAVISDGFENSFHHPHAEVLERLTAHRAEILRTDTEGLITIRTDGWRMYVSTYRQDQ